MNGDDEDLFEDDAEESVAAEHTLGSAVPFGIARAAQGRSTANTALPKDRPVACWKLDDICFDRAFIELTACPAFAQLAQLDEKLVIKFKKLYNDRPRLSLFGHADPVGPKFNKETYNKVLSERRAKAVYAVLTRKPNLWLEIFDGPRRAYLKERLKATDANLTAAIKQHMDTLCGQFVLQDGDFLGGGQCAYRGCSQFNPVLVFSQDEEQDLQKNRAERNEENLVAFHLRDHIPAFGIDHANILRHLFAEGRTNLNNVLTRNIQRVINDDRHTLHIGVQQRRHRLRSARYNIGKLVHRDNIVVLCELVCQWCRCASGRVVKLAAEHKHPRIIQPFLRILLAAQPLRRNGRLFRRIRQ